MICDICPNRETCDQLCQEFLELYDVPEIIEPVDDDYPSNDYDYSTDDLNNYEYQQDSVR